MAKTSPITFFRQVRAEMAKVTWPTRRETWVSTVMVVIMVILAALFLFVADWIISSVLGWGINYLGSLF
ncbi:MAG: preprotein translocase subunit SecE [Candidatus Tokpelaia sp.]|uniref:preprotein translocase subunit SecE n=1 Tax=Candidatus Tokpelaia sp. TaxID=2233777 RepID=UPI001239D9AF|nr:preprotein translocase subunit SecE [Candidatus Tokpelaia sp.]KAA6204352.1 MAG: preprotein translocase subunit SecE [Candidatus Tokpelaia sp.]KAA6205321.1 MAG: preprotein translocase subunit SecE [Candidatus Tokpelaia sp.]KAA6404978.1 preprotein translocase subunit SecE [Candidatus Tokpelaia sp.]